MTSKGRPTGTPRFFQVEQVLRQRVHRSCTAGDRFSSEWQLAAEFGVSRTLIRGVLDRLENDGLLRREPRNGTFVVGRRAARRPPELRDLLQSLNSYAPRTTVKVLDIARTLGERDAKVRLGVGEADPFVVVRRMLFDGATPFGYLVSYLPYDLGRGLTAPDIERKPLSSLVSSAGHPVVAAEQMLEPILADPELATHLELPVGAAVLLIERLFLSPRRAAIYLTRGFYRGDRYRYIETVALRRSKGVTGTPGD